MNKLEILHMYVYDRDVWHWILQPSSQGKCNMSNLLQALKLEYVIVQLHFCGFIGLGTHFVFNVKNVCVLK